MSIGFVALLSRRRLLRHAHPFIIFVASARVTRRHRLATDRAENPDLLCFAFPCSPNFPFPYIHSGQLPLAPLSFFSSFPPSFLSFFEPDDPTCSDFFPHPLISVSTVPTRVIGCLRTTGDNRIALKAEQAESESESVLISSRRRLQITDCRHQSAPVTSAASFGPF